ncbi:hypothetical protein HIM_00670 [Hirsutella minnesotensis 3608]|nr:hypothetical protein HIM_00670 [Hirsutella minnesotensis 3608]
MPSQRPFFLSSFLSAFRQQGPALPSAQQANKHTTQASSSAAAATSAAAANSSSTTAFGHQAPTARPTPASTITSSASAASHSYSRSPPASVPYPSARGAVSTTSGIPIPNPSAGRRRGSDSSSEGFRDALGADKWYIGGRTAGGEERFFKLGVMRRVRSNDGLSLDRLSL